MSVRSRLTRRLEVLFWKGRAEAELEDEIRYHVEQEIDENIRSGMGAAEARRKALVAFGGVERAKEEVRDARGGRLLDDFMQDVRFALRSLGRQPGFLVVALLTLGLGVGANVALFGVVDLALWRSLPFPGADRLVAARTTFGPRRERNIWTSSWPDFEDYRDGTSSFSALSAVAPFGLDVTLSGNGEAERVRGTWIAPGFFSTLGVRPLLGREFVPEENEAEAPPVAVISHRLWQRWFGGAGDVVGTRMVVDGVPRTVVGIAPAGFVFLTDVDIWAPLAQAGWGMARQSQNWIMVGRLAPDVTVGAAQAEVDVIAGRLAAAYPDSNRDKGLLLMGLQEALLEGFRPSLFGLMAALGLVLVVGCANVAGLLLARGSARRAEMAVRTALGAGRGRLVRQLLAESALVGFAAAALGTILALALQPALVATTPLRLVGIRAAGVPLTVLGFAVALALATVVTFGLPPALSAVRMVLVEDMKSGGRQATAGARGRVRNALVVAQVALSLVLLLWAGLLYRGMLHVQRVDPGFAPVGVLTAQIGLPRGQYEDGGQRARFFETLLERIRALPGVESAGAVSRLPIRDAGDNVGVFEAGHAPAYASETLYAFERMVMPGYFDAMEIPVLAGRDVQPTDGPDTPPVLVISQELARTLFPGRDPLGLQVAADLAGDTIVAEVVGVVGDVRGSSLAQDAGLAMYFSYRQRPSRTMGLAVRAAGPTTSLVGPLRLALRELDPAIPLSEVRTMEDVLSESVSFTRTVAVAMGVFAAAALFLTGVGLFGVLAYHVERRRREIGIRVALGARATDVFLFVLRRGLTPVGLGIGVGTAVAVIGWWWTRALHVPLSASDPTAGLRLEADPLAIVGAAAFLAVVAAVACLGPALRAFRIDPVAAFKAE